jgi:hypothetical protein
MVGATALGIGLRYLDVRCRPDGVLRCYRRLRSYPQQCKSKVKRRMLICAIPGRAVACGFCPRSANLFWETIAVECLFLALCSVIAPADIRHPWWVISHLHTNLADFALTGLVVRGSRVCSISNVGVADC